MKCEAGAGQGAHNKIDHQPHSTLTCETETRPKTPHLGLYCRYCSKWLAWIPQGTAEDRERKLRDRLMLVMGGRPVTGSQAHLLRDSGADVPGDRAEASKLIGELLAGRKGGAL